METPLTPLEFARRARKLYPEHVAIVDGDSSWTYAEFQDRCDRWSAVLQKLGIRSGDRVAYLSPNTHAQLESFYAVPQVGAVLVPLNYRLIAGRFRLPRQSQRLPHDLRRSRLSRHDRQHSFPPSARRTLRRFRPETLKTGSTTKPRSKPVRLNLFVPTLARPICSRSITPAELPRVRKA
jgi:acyl-CoA synthetase (AMP-forming)/AMP-acid ligase II